MASSQNSTKPFYSVHGRFQPFHNGHLNYVRSALELCDHLYIGITQIQRSNMIVTQAAPHRSELASNPFSFFERRLMIQETLLSEGISQERFELIPFPHDQADFLPECFPIGGVCFTTVHSEWNNEKIRRLTSYGYEVRVITNPDKWPLKRASATKIRELIRSSDLRWKDFVPRRIGQIIEASYISRFVQTV